MTARLGRNPNKSVATQVPGVRLTWPADWLRRSPTSGLELQSLCKQKTCVFDATRPVAIQLRGPDGLKTVRVRFPSDDEWAERQRRRKVIVKQLGRGISETTIPNGEEIDAALLAQIRTEEAPEVDAFEAQKVIEQLATCEVDDAVLAGDAFRITTRVLGGTTTHLLGCPPRRT